MDKSTDYAKEFDERVTEYNEWLTSPKSRIQQRSHWEVFFDGLSSVFGIFPSNLEIFQDDHPLYSRANLTPEQKDAIAFASDWQRISNDLEKIISTNTADETFSVEETTMGKGLAQAMYEHFRNIYVAYALQKEKK